MLKLDILMYSMKNIIS